MPQLPPRFRPLPPSEPPTLSPGSLPQDIVYSGNMPPAPDKTPRRPPVATKPVSRSHNRPRLGLAKLNMKLYSPDYDQMVDNLLASGPGNLEDLHG